MKKGIPSVLDRIRSSISLSTLCCCQQMAHHGQAFPVGESVQGHLAVVGSAAPGVDKLRPVGEDQKYS